MATIPTPTPTATPQEAQPSDEVMRKLLKPTPKLDQVIGILKKSYVDQDHYLTLKIKKELESYDDKNYWVEISGTDYLCKVHNGVESKDLISKVAKSEYESSVIHLQNSIMQHLNHHGIATSSPLKPLDKDEATILPTSGSLHPLPVHSREHSPCSLVVRLLRWVPGRTMESLKMMPLETLADAGHFLGSMHDKLDSLDVSKLLAANRYHQWDGKNTRDLTKFLHCIDDPQNKAMVSSVLDAFQKDLINSGDSTQFQQGLIHGDFNDANMLVNDDCRVSGVIDFGDSVKSWRILDVSVAMAYAMLSTYGKKGRSISAAAAFLRGYNATHPLSAVERKHLILLVACRLSCSVTLGAYSYKQDPTNQYLLLHAKPAWDALSLLWGTDEGLRSETRTLLDAIFEQACAKSDNSKGTVDCSDLTFSDPNVPDPLASIRTASASNENGSGRPTKQQRTT